MQIAVMTAPQPLGGFGHARRQLAVFHWRWGFGLEQLPATDPQHRQHGHHQHNHPHTTNPVHQRAPDIERRRQGVEAGQHGRPRRGQAGYGLEIGVSKAQIGQIDE